MAQHDYVIANGTGAAVRSDLNNALAAIVSQNSGATAPATTYAFQFWADTTTGLLKLRNSANSAWITLFQLDGEWSTLPVENGTAAAPSIYFKDSGTDTGFYSPGTDQVAISTGGTGRLFINSSGSVGIGTSSPAERLHLSGTSSWVRLDATAAGGGNFMLGSSEIGGSRAFSIYDVSGSAYRLSINSSGNVGIGTTSPGVKVDIVSDNNTSQTSVLRVNSNNVAVNTALAYDGVTCNSLMYVGTTSSNPLVFNINSTERARIDSSGRLLVGTSTARANFFNASLLSSAVQIEGTTHNTSGLSIVRNEAGSTPYICFGASRGTTIGSNIILQANDPCGYLTFQGNDGSEFVEAAIIKAEIDGTPGANDMPGRLVFSTTADGASSPTERMRISSGGEVRIGFTGGIASGQVFSLGVQNSTKAAAFHTTASSGYSAITCSRDNNGAVLEAFFQTTQVGSISVTSTTTTYNTSSDYRLKENVTAVADGITRLQQLKPSRFNFISEPGKTVDGFIAHEVQTVVPEAITGEKDAEDADGNPIYQGIDQSKLVPLLTAALQEAVGEIESLKARVAALESA